MKANKEGSRANYGVARREYISEEEKRVQTKSCSIVKY
jgi:hypothetical protein